MLAYALGTLMLDVVPPASPIRMPTWGILAASLLTVSLVAAFKRSATYVRYVALQAVGIAGVAVGLGAPLYMATTSGPRLLRISAIVFCGGYALVGVASLLSLRAFRQSRG